MVHQVSAPALQRLRRLINQRVRPFVVTNAQQMTVEASPELFESIPYAGVASLPFREFTIGEPWGRPWHTVWFKLSGQVPALKDSEGVDDRRFVAHIDLGFSGRGDGFQVEGLAWQNGRRIQAVQPDRRLVPVDISAKDSKFEIWVEAAATPIVAGHESGYGPTPLGDPLTAGNAFLYNLRRAELGVFQPDVFDLSVILHSVMDLIIAMDDHEPQRPRLFAMVEEVENILDRSDVPGTAKKAVEFLRSRLQGLPGNSEGDVTHRIVATGHAHLDTAWLWPLRETRRKAVRTFVNAVGLLEKNSELVFSHSQAQQYAWVQEDAPEVFEEVQSLVAAGQWEPVGGMWVETDLNLPTGESLLRHFVIGQRSFMKWFGRRSEVAFLPDDFGYPGSLPQIVKHSGGRWFFTQKMSWNESNAFPHHSFWWEGIDGSRLFTHFSPVETYNALLTPSQMRFAARNFRDHRGASQSLALFGHGDGGGGPTQEMVDRGRLSQLLPGVPQVQFGSVTQFFESAESEYASTAPVWVGEMYLEKHRGTYSSQIQTKQGNRRCERLLHELELWSAFNRVPQPELPELWQRVLTQQFHDIIPGSSIAWVHRDAEQEHHAVAETIESLLSSILTEAPEGRNQDIDESSSWTIFNPAPVSRREVVVRNGQPMWIEVPAFGQVKVSAPDTPILPPLVQPVSCEQDPSGAVTISNGLISCTWDERGYLSRFEMCTTGRNVIGPVFDSNHPPRASGQQDVHQDVHQIGGQLCLRRDTPAEYDAWDIDRADADAPPIFLVAQSAPTVTVENSAMVQVKTSYGHGVSTFNLLWTLRAGSTRLEARLDADWHGSEERLQWVMPVNVLAREALCGIQFGHVRRARHQNTSWDAARFEVCAHRYVYISEPGCGVGVLADGPRGYDVRNQTLALTLLRAPRFPDPACDLGPQTIEWSLYLNSGAQDIALLENEAARMAHPLRFVEHSVPSSTIPVVVDADGVMVSTIKLAEDGSGDLIVRLWECRGARSSGTMRMAGQVLNVERCDALEEIDHHPNSEITWKDDGEGHAQVDLNFAPFEIRSYRIKFAPR